MMAATAAENPFPGLRPFEREDSYLFFGRERETDDLLRRLDRSRLLAVIGTSGSGKSSLVRAGLLPSLDRGYLVSAGSNWRTVVLRPGGDPIGSLASAMAESAGTAVAEMRAKLERSSLGLLHAVRDAALQPSENLLIVVDQFEEIFRFKSAGGSAESASAFVKLLLSVAGQNEVPVFVVLTMRSDYLGECARFRGLPEALNDAQYLVPRLTREELKEAIEGPAAVFGGSIAPRLVQQLLNDAAGGADHLPVLQHALMRTWEAAAAARAAGQPLDLDHYETAGGVEHALDRHAEDVYAALDPSGQRIARRLFQCITEVGGVTSDVRRPAALREICEVAGASPDQVGAVIDAFRSGGTTFLLPKAGEPLNPDSVVDISHESLMRLWKRLRRWAQEEAIAAELYQRLARSAELYPERESLWRDPGLELALDWKRDWQPNRAWAARYRGDFERAMKFLESSRVPRDRIRRLKKVVARVSVVGVPLIVALLALQAQVTSRLNAGNLALEDLRRSDSRTDPRETARRLEGLRIAIMDYRELEQRAWWNPLVKLENSGRDALERGYSRYFQDLILADVRNGLQTSLAKLPSAPQPGDDLSSAYDSLRAYLMITANPDKTELPFLPSYLFSIWSAGRNYSPDELALVRRQFDFWAAHPRPVVAADPAARDRARTYVGAFDSVERVYLSLVARANAKFPPVRLEPNASVIAATLVAGAFTVEGWQYIKDAAPGSSNGLDSWVVGDRVSMNWSSGSQQALKALFERDCIAAWSAFLTSARVTPFRDLTDAASKLKELASPKSPLLHLFQIVSHGTNVPGKVADAFQPVRYLIPPDAGERWMRPPNKPYADALIALAQAVATQAAGRSSGIDVVGGPAANLLAAGRMLSSQFNASPTLRVDRLVEDLLLAPAISVQALTRGLGASELNAKAAALCNEMRPVLARYPFRRAGEEAPFRDVDAIFNKANGRLWQAYRGTFEKVLGSKARYPASSFDPTAPNVNLSPEFVAFFNRAIDFSNALYSMEDLPATARLRLELLYGSSQSSQSSGLEWFLRLRRPNGSLFTPPLQSKEPVFVDWLFDASEVELRSRGAASNAALLAYKGPWAIFRWFDDADSFILHDRQADASWSLRAGAGGAPSKAPASLTLTVGGVDPRIFQPEFRASIGCAQQVAK